MSGSIIPTPAYKAVDGQSFGTQVEKARLSLIALSLTNYDNDSVPQIAAGSVVEISGAIFLFSTNDSIVGTPSSDSLNYIMLEVSGSGDSQTVTGTWTTTAPTWNDAKQGYYDAGGTKRYVGGCYYDGTNYSDKWIYKRPENNMYTRANGSLRPLKYKTVEIGDWDMDADQNKEVAHGLGSGYKKIKILWGIFRSDNDDQYYTIPCANADVQVSFKADGGSNTETISSTVIRLWRRGSGEFDGNSKFDATSYNRGWLTIGYED